jgi:hypothetical protein
MPADKYVEHIKRARSDRYRGKNTVFIATEQTAGPPVETKPLEQENLVPGDCVHAHLPRPPGSRIFSTIKKI